MAVGSEKKKVFGVWGCNPLAKVLQTRNFTPGWSIETVSVITVL